MRRTLASSCGGTPKDAPEDLELFFRGHAVGLGHLAGQRDHRDGEGDAGIALVVEEEMPGHGADQRAHGAADQEAGAPHH